MLPVRRSGPRHILASGLGEERVLGLVGSVVQENGDLSSFSRPGDQLNAGVPGWQSPGRLCSSWSGHGTTGSLAVSKNATATENSPQLTVSVCRIASFEGMHMRARKGHEREGLEPQVPSNATVMGSLACWMPFTNSKVTCSSSRHVYAPFRQIVAYYFARTSLHSRVVEALALKLPRSFSTLAVCAPRGPSNTGKRSLTLIFGGSPACRLVLLPKSPPNGLKSSEWMARYAKTGAGRH